MSRHIILVPLSGSGLCIVRVVLIEELVIETRLKESSELHRVTLNMVPISLKDPKVVPVSPPHVDMTLQLMIEPNLVHWYDATSLEHI